MSRDPSLDRRRMTNLSSHDHLSLGSTVAQLRNSEGQIDRTTQRNGPRHVHTYYVVSTKAGKRRIHGTYSLKSCRWHDTVGQWLCLSTQDKSTVAAGRAQTPRRSRSRRADNPRITSYISTHVAQNQPASEAAGSRA
jgi:hypothetical protein